MARILGKGVRFTLWHRKPYQSGPKVGTTSGRFSTKGLLFTLKKTPTYTELTSQQKLIAEKGRRCKGLLKGVKDYAKRTRLAAECIRYQFNKPAVYEEERREVAEYFRELEKAG